MRFLSYKDFLYLKTFYREKGKPMAPNMTINKIANMVAKKTKFRPVDCEEVLRESVSAIFASLLDRKTVNLDYFIIKNDWQKRNYPKFIKSGLEQDVGDWSYGFYKPKLTFSTKARTLYMGTIKKEFQDIVDRVAPYMKSENKIETESDLLDHIDSVIAKTSQEGKYLCIDEEGFIIYPEGSKKRPYKIRFDYNFHPTWGEKMTYFKYKRLYIREWEELKKEDPTLPFSYVTEKLQNSGFASFDVIFEDEEGKNTEEDIEEVEIYDEDEDFVEDDEL